MQKATRQVALARNFATQDTVYHSINRLSRGIGLTPTSQNAKIGLAHHKPKSDSDSIRSARGMERVTGGMVQNYQERGLAESGGCQADVQQRGFRRAACR